LCIKFLDGRLLAGSGCPSYAASPRRSPGTPPPNAAQYGPPPRSAPPPHGRTAEGLLALGSAAQMRLEITITRGIEPDLVERQQAAGHRVRGRLTDPHRPGALVEGRCVRVGQNRQPPGAAPPRSHAQAAHGPTPLRIWR